MKSVSYAFAYLLSVFIVFASASCCSPRLVEMRFTGEKNRRVDELTKQLVDIERALCRLYVDLDKPDQGKSRRLTTDPEISYVETLYRLKVKLQAELTQLVNAPTSKETSRGTREQKPGTK